MTSSEPKQVHSDIQDFDAEIKKHETAFRRTVFGLAIAILFSISTLLYILLFEHGLGEVFPLLIAVFLSGILGSGTSALISALERHANGYEFAKGQKHPEGGKPDRFNLRINPFFRYRPILGIAVAFLIFVILKGGIVSIENLNLYHLIFYCSLSSFFAKTLIEKSKNVIKSINVKL